MFPPRPRPRRKALSMSPLSDAELSLVCAIEKGEPFNIERPCAPSDVEQTEMVRAEVLVQIVRRQLLPIQGLSRRIAVTNAGIHLSGAKITGSLNLEDGSAPDGSPLTRLSLEDCWFENPILLRRSHLQSLSLRYSRFKTLDASDTRIEGPVDLTGVRGIDKPESEIIGRYGQCWVVLSTAKIAGRVAAGYARFVAPEKRIDFVTLSQIAHYALDLRGAHVESSIYLRPKCVAEGGISLTLASVDGSVWANGVRARGLEEHAFAADYAEIRGSLYLRPNDRRTDGKDDSTEELANQFDTEAVLAPDPAQPLAQEPEPFYAKGCVSLFACRLGGSLYLDGAKVETLKENPEKIDEQDSVDVRSAEIGGYCTFRSWQSKRDPSQTYRFEAKGSILLNSTRVKSDLSFSGALVKAIDAQNIEIGGDCSFTVKSFEGLQVVDRFISAGSINLTGAAIKGDLDFRGALVGAPLRSESSASHPAGNKKDAEKKNDTLSISGSNIGGDCYLSAYSQLYEGKTGSYIRGVRFQCNGNIAFSESRITNSLYMDGAKLKGSPDDEGNPVLDLSGTIVGGNAFLNTWHEANVRTSLPFIAQGGTIVLRLAGAQIGQQLSLNGAQIRACRKTPAGQSERAKSVYAVNAINANIQGKAVLSTFLGMAKGRDKHFRFTARGLVSFATATIKLGLDMEGSRLTSIAGNPAGISGQDGDPVESISDGNADKQYEAPSLALDLSDAHMKFASLGNDRWEHAFEGVGNLVFRHTKVDAEMKMAGAILHGSVIAKGASVGTSIEMAGATLHGSVIAKGASVGTSIEMAGATLHGSVIVDGVNVGSSMDFARITLRGSLDALGAKIGGSIYLTEASLCESLVISGTTIEDSVYLMNAHLEGPLFAAGLRIKGSIDLTETNLRGPLSAEGARIGTSVRLNKTSISRRSIDAAIERATMPAEQRTDAKSVRRRVINEHIERVLQADISFKDAEIGNALFVRDLRVPKLPDLSEYPDLRHSTIDLRGLRIGELDDFGGLAWGKEVRLWLDGFRYARLPEVIFSRRPESPALFLKIAFKRLWNPSALLREVAGKAPEVSAQLDHNDAEHISKALAWFIKNFRSGGVWERRLRWLGLQYFNCQRPKPKEYSPEAWEQLVGGLNATGSYEDARRISSARLTTEARFKRGLMGFFWRLFRIFFDYGFSVTRASVTFVLCIMLGTVAAKIADNRFSWIHLKESVLVLNTSTPEAAVDKDGKGFFHVYALEADQSRRFENPVPCGGRINNALYALDVFVPVLNLHQQEICSIDRAKTPWRYGQALYAVLGWILTPLTILTITGILRRHLEK
jgi:hypothetical protein